jgi:hypothetical protein
MESQRISYKFTKNVTLKYERPAIQFKVYLKVKYTDKNEAKKLGCRWDPEDKEWYVTVAKPMELPAFKRFELAHVGYHDEDGTIGFDQFKAMHDVVSKISKSCRKQCPTTQWFYN